ncbi:MAG: carboxypeptidase-like regulatory domain-containing protein [Thermoguttaceae bacterium]|nr:carboxypeptidase-like regulatory domain-containing protein [Thermoguttaceae bacterium]
MNMRPLPCVLVLLVAGSWLVGLAPGAAPTKATLIGDIRLEDGAVLVGQVVTPENAPMQGVEVSLVNGKQTLGTAKTNAKGYFAFRGLKNGVYQVAVGQDQMAYRVWSKETAPPSAHPGARIVVGKDVVRGQYAEGHFLKAALSNPFVVGGLVATAVAVPIVIHNSHDEPASP